jgi:sec-independent protein translocase protein TatB
MFNLGGGELLVILLVALLVLGPAKLPSAAKQFGKVMADFRNMSAGFQKEMRDAMQDPIEAATRDRSSASNDVPDGSGTADPEVSTAEQAGMYDAEPPAPTSQPDDEDQN